MRTAPLRRHTDDSLYASGEFCKFTTESVSEKKFENRRN